MGQLQRCSFLLYPALTLHYLLQVGNMHWNSSWTKLYQSGCWQYLLHPGMFQLAGGVPQLMMTVLPACRRLALL